MTIEELEHLDDCLIMGVFIDCGTPEFATAIKLTEEARDRLRDGVTKRELRAKASERLHRIQHLERLNSHLMHELSWRGLTGQGCETCIDPSKLDCKNDGEPIWPKFCPDCGRKIGS